MNLRLGFLVLLTVIAASSSWAAGLRDYRVVRKACVVGAQTWVALREFSAGTASYALLVEPRGLKTQVVDVSSLNCHEISFAQLPESLYKKLLGDEVQAPFPLADDGLKNLSSLSQGNYLTVDLCPSTKPFETEIFNNPEVRRQKNFPVAISVSGGWMRDYPTELAWLKTQQRDGNLNIVWVNHSYTHPYHRGVPNGQNFLLGPGVNFADEVLMQEQYMISLGLTPSVFFRFPGLISDESQIRELGDKYGLVSLGTDAWLAWGQKPKAGSIVLIHGNGNETLGVHLFMKWIDQLADLGVFHSLVN